MYQKLPKIQYTANEEIKILNSIYTDDIYYEDRQYESLNSNLSFHLNNLKNEINFNQTKWEKYRSITNPYEFINTSIPGFIPIQKPTPNPNINLNLNINKGSNSVCKLTPLSRSFFKMIEIINTFQLVKDLPNNINSYHLAEGPGGFIEALSYIRMNRMDNYYGMTLIDEDNNSIPGWKKSKNFLLKNPNVRIENGIDGKGDLTNLDNLVDCHTRHTSSMEIITADGGFDFSADYNNQETTSLSLIIHQIAFAIAMQKKGGHFVIKVFDTFKRASLDIIYILSFLYEEVYFIKPNTSRYTNSEKYIVCKYFRIENNESWVHAFYHIAKKAIHIKHSEKYAPIRILSHDIPLYFTGFIIDMNYTFGYQQIQHMLFTFKLINSSENINKYTSKYKNENIKKCIEWCKINNVPYNKLLNLLPFQIPNL